ncbi:MAG: Fur family transcriptional regulator [Candidatus Hydromicrobium sp.]|nr:Fur family transcriptional regulator [Candidatus Hydromicrobium sp.]
MAKISKENLNSKYVSFSKEKLIKSGYKLTKSREAIIEIMGETLKLYDADSLYLEVKKDNLDIGIATIYRTLELLSRLQIICRIIFGSGKTYYMLAEDCHKQTLIYMVCNNCKKIITNNEFLNNSIEIRLKDSAEKDILDNCNLKIENYQVLFTGLCDECNKS